MAVGCTANMKRAEGRSLAMTITWDEYLTVPNAESKYLECAAVCRSTFAQQRQNIARLVESRRPKSVVCLGAGVLNDIPYPELVRISAKVHLVDWLRNSCETGVALSLIHEDENCNPTCVDCDPQIGSPQEYCENFYGFVGAENAPTGVCSRFEPTDSQPVSCREFVQGKFPLIFCEDVSGGYSGRFAKRWSRELQKVSSWKQVFARGDKLARRVESSQQQLSIPSHAADLVTSSMVVTQFDHEPYGFFFAQSAEKLGPIDQAEAKQLQPAAQAVQDMLFSGQLRGHFAEIARILAPEGVCYLSFEMFHQVPNSSRLHLVQGVPEILTMAGEHFYFDENLLPGEEWMKPFRNRGEPSLVASLLLHPKGDGIPAGR
jgi:hypothetical protein